MGHISYSCSDFLMNRSYSTLLDPHSILCLQDNFRSHSVLYFFHLQVQYQDACILQRKKHKGNEKSVIALNNTCTIQMAPKL